MRASLAREVSRVVRNGNCSGCGGCAQFFPEVTMALWKDRYLRPIVSTDCRTQAAIESFRSFCPGVSVKMPSVTTENLESDVVFGPYVSAWVGWATDSAMRNAGSSGGVLTALSDWLVATGRTNTVLSSKGRENSSRSETVALKSRADSLSAAGSRYAPVANLPLFVLNSSENALVGKPCEVSTARKIAGIRETESNQEPLLMSFFCAGVPSQAATDSLISKLGVAVDKVISLRYRGSGWPGDFTVSDSSGDTGTLSYSKSWGAHLGRDLQWRCKICPDGTSRFSDIAVGDFWETNSDGYPVFEEGEGRSFVFARTERGDEVLRAAARDGVLSLAVASPDSLGTVQPLQVTRTRTLVGRLVGRRAAGYAVPRYQGFGLFELAGRHPIRNIRAALGTFKRSARTRMNHPDMQPDQM